MPGQDRLPTLSEKNMRSKGDDEYEERLEAYFGSSPESNVDKLKNFCKYVPRQSLTRFLTKYELFKKILRVQGSIVECGVFLGGGLMSWAQLSTILEPVNHQRKVIGFDTFSGIPAISEDDATSRSDQCTEGALSADSYDDLVKCIGLFDRNRFLGHIPKVELVKGDIKDTVPRYLEVNPHTVVSLLYLDAVVFEPTLSALRGFRERIPKGGIVVFDELNSGQWPGETLAVMKAYGIAHLRIRRFPFDSFISYAVME